MGTPRCVAQTSDWYSRYVENACPENAGLTIRGKSPTRSNPRPLSSFVGKPDTPYVVAPARRTMSRAEKLKPTFNLTKNAASVTEIPTGVIPRTIIVESQM